MEITGHPMADAHQETLPIDHQFDVRFANSLARLESYNKHLYRPNTYLHKWWARRCGTTFRSILKHLVPDPMHQDYYSPGGLEGKIVLDPMVGGGTSLHEAIRLGANVIGADLDPIPLLQARASLSHGSLPELRAAFTRFFGAIRRELRTYYLTSCPQCGLSCELRYALHGLHRRCHCREALFVDSFVLRQDNDGSTIHLHSDTNDIFRDGKLTWRASALNEMPILEKKTRVCDRCHQKYREDLGVPYYRRYLPVAVIGECEAHGLFFAPPRQHDLDMVALADAKRESLNNSPDDFMVYPGPKSKSLVDRNIRSYLDLYSSRQLLYLRLAIDHVADLEPLARLNLSLLVSTSLEFNAMLCGYKGSKKYRPGTIRHVFARHAYAFPYTALENNPVYLKKASGTLQNLFHSRIVRGRTWALKPTERRLVDGGTKIEPVEGEVDAGKEVSRFSELQRQEQRFLLVQGSSVSLNLPDHCVDFVVTDPPYFDSVQYGDLAAFFRVWLRQLLPDDIQWDYALAESAVDQHANGDGQYTSVLSGIFRECHRILKAHGRLVLTYHHWNPQGWFSLTVALKRAGFRLVNHYVVHAENRASVHIVNQKALLHDVILVLAPTASQTGREWQPPQSIRKQESELFCQQCGTIVGWMLDSPLSEAEMEARWESLLA
jgi:putative DNA methylase